MDSGPTSSKDRCFSLDKYRFCDHHDPPAGLPDLMLVEPKEPLPEAKRQRTQEPQPLQAKPPTIAPSDAATADISPLDSIPNDVLSLVLSHTAAVSSSPGDFINLLLTSRRICQLGQQAQVLKSLPLKALQVEASDWCPSSLKFLLRCSQAGNAHACYALGMIGFYCLGRPNWGTQLLAQSALANCPEALYSLAVIHFNGSGASKEHRDVAAGVALCMQAAALGHADALRELGHCFQDGYGVPRDAVQGRQLLIRANLADATDAVRAGTFWHPQSHHPCCSHHVSSGCTAVEQVQHLADYPLVVYSPPGEQFEALPPSQMISRWRRRSRSKASLGKLARSLSAPPVLRSPQTVFSLFNTSEDCTRATPAPCNPSTTCLGLNLNLTLSLAPPQAQGSFHNPTTGVLSNPGNQAQTPVGLEDHQLQRDTQQSAAVGGHAHVVHQCFCLPAVMLPLHALSDGWVRIFMLDWHYLVEVGEIECLSLDDVSSHVRTGQGHVAQGTRLCCSSPVCGRVESREDEFRCCSACTEARYCSRVCQALDWKMGHKSICARLVELQLLQDEAEE